MLVVGAGGREHALAWRLASEGEVIATPGNPGIAQVAECRSGSPLEIARQVRPDLIVVGPEDPLIAGLAGELRREGFAVLGPSAPGARLEASKAAAKEAMAAAGVLTAAHRTFTSFDAAVAHVRTRFAEGRPVVVKASGAALGKGVVVAESAEEAEEALHRFLVAGEIGEAGRTVVVEDRLSGPEFSLLTLVSGRHFRSLPVAQDYKRVGDGNQGPNTGGMGSVAPAPWVTPELIARAEQDLVAPIVNWLADKEIDYRGVLFTGAIVDRSQPTCLEYNVRFGDPETQSVMPLMGRGFVEALRACALGEPLPEIEVKPGVVVTVVAASEGYPGAVVKGREITMAEMPAGVQVFHAGTAMAEGKLVTSGGRVLAVSAKGDDLASARELAYEGMSRVCFDGMRYRKDIGEHNEGRP